MINIRITQLMTLFLFCFISDCLSNNNYEKEIRIYRSDLLVGLTNNLINCIQQADSRITINSGLNRFSPIWGKIAPSYDIPYTYSIYSNNKRCTWLLGHERLFYHKPRFNYFMEVYSPGKLLRELLIGRNDVSLDDYRIRDKIRLKKNNHSFSLKYLVSKYIVVDNIECSYKLDGYSEEWSPFSSGAEVSFSDVPIGDYVFKIRYKEDVLDTGYKDISVPIKISSLWYQTIYARIIYILLTLLLLTYIIYLLKKYFQYIPMTNAMQDKESNNHPAQPIENFPKHSLVTALTIIYHTCDQLRDKNTSYEQLCRNTDLIREMVMSLMFSSDAFSKEEVKKISPVTFTIAANMCVKELAEEVLELFEKRGYDVANIYIRIPHSLNYKVYTNALRCFFYYLYSFAFLGNNTSEMSINASEEQGEMYLVLTSKSGLIKELYRLLSEAQTLTKAKQLIDDAFQTEVLHHFVLSTLEQICKTYKYDEYEEVGRLTFVFFPAVVPQQAEEKKTILVLEDREEMIWLITSVLSSEYQVHPVKTIQSALEYVKQTPPVLFLVDMLMYVDMEDIFMEYVSKNRPLLSKTAFIPMISWKTSTSIQQELIKWSDSYIILPYDILYLNQVLYKVIYGKQETKQIYIEELGDLSDQIICYTDEQADFIKQLLRVVKMNVDREDMSSTFIAEQLAMSPRQFYRKFKEISSISPSNLIKNYRMERAAQLLLKEKASIQDVILEVGIASRSYFYKEFTHKYGMTPKEYRESHNP